MAAVRGCPCPVAGRSLRPSMAFAHSMLTAPARSPPLRHPACDDQSAETDRCPSNAGSRDMGSPSRTRAGSIKAPGGSRGTPGVNAISRAMQIREEPNDPVSPDFRPGLFVKRAPGPEGRVSTSRRRSAKRRSAGCRAVACRRSRHPARQRSRPRIAHPPRRAKLLLPYWISQHSLPGSLPSDPVRTCQER